MTALIGIKLDQSQAYNMQGRRMAVTLLRVGPCVVINIAPDEENQRNLVTLGLMSDTLTKKHSKPVTGQLKKAKIKDPKKIVTLRQFVISTAEKYEIGQTLTVSEIFKPGELIDVTGITKGRGFAGVMKRWGFHGGPKTHGQSDRPRSPGSIGAGTTPGRVFKGKKMAGHFGTDTQTVKNALVLDINDTTNVITIKGLIPGYKQGFVTLVSTGKTKNNFSALAVRLADGPSVKDTLADKPSRPTSETSKPVEKTAETKDDPPTHPKKASDKSEATDTDPKDKPEITEKSPKENKNKEPKKE